MATLQPRMLVVLDENTCLLALFWHRFRPQQDAILWLQNVGKLKGRNLAGEELAFQLGEKRVQLGLGMQAKAIHKQTRAVENVVVYFGIIDFLQARPLPIEATSTTEWALFGGLAPVHRRL